MRMADRAETELVWATQIAEELLSALDERWRHTLTIVDHARAFRGVLPDGELGTLEAAAYLHDIGYAPALVQTGFHPLDGARFVRAAGYERLAGLVRIIQQLERRPRSSVSPTSSTRSPRRTRCSLAP